MSVITTADITGVMAIARPNVFLWHYDGSLPFIDSYLDQIVWENPNVSKPTQEEWDIAVVEYLSQ